MSNYIKVKPSLDKLLEAVGSNRQKKDVFVALGYSKHPNGNIRRKIENWYAEEGLNLKELLEKNRYITKNCPVCTKEYTRLWYDETTTCSRGCANTYFMSGEDHPNYKENAGHRAMCLRNHEAKCVVCGECKVIDVHHNDENKSNNSPQNLIPLCPTHHAYVHRGYKDLVQDDIDAYIEEWTKRNLDS